MYLVDLLLNHQSRARYCPICGRKLVRLESDYFDDNGKKLYKYLYCPIPGYTHGEYYDQAHTNNAR